MSMANDQEPIAGEPDSGSPQILGIAPQLLVDDLNASVAYYQSCLGFKVEFVYEGFYASVSRDGCEIHLKHATKVVEDRQNRKDNEHLDAAVQVVGIDSLYTELQGRGAQISKPLELRPWKVRDFYVEDPDGYILCFGEQA